MCETPRSYQPHFYHPPTITITFTPHPSQLLTQQCTAIAKGLVITDPGCYLEPTTTHHAIVSDPGCYLEPTTTHHAIVSDPRCYLEPTTTHHAIVSDPGCYLEPTTTHHAIVSDPRCYLEPTTTHHAIITDPGCYLEPTTTHHAIVTDPRCYLEPTTTHHATGAGEATHVLQYTNNGKVHLTAEGNLFTNCCHSDILRRGDDDCTFWSRIH